MNLLPCPRSLKRLPGTFTLPRRAIVHLDASLPDDVVAAIVSRLQAGLERRPPARRKDCVGVQALACSDGTLKRELQHGVSETGALSATIRAVCSESAPPYAEGYVLTIDRRGVQIGFLETAGLRAAVATLRQLFRQYGRRLPCLKIHDWPDFARRGVMLDISRGRVPRLETLLELVEHLADFKINELQLYTEHTFAYRHHQSVWRSWGALTGDEIHRLDARCRQLGIDLVPNQNSFGHLEHFLAQPRLKKLAEASRPYADAGGEFVRRPSTLAPNHPGTLPFLRGLYAELLPNFSSWFFNVGCDETWDLGRGQSKKLCAAKGRGRVYLDFLKQIHREVSARGKRMMFWGDIILKYPKLIPELAKLSSRSSRRESAPFSSNLADDQSGLTSAATLNCGNIIALNWGYEAEHPFDREAALFAKAKIPFYICPGTSTWQSLIGRHDNALANMRAAAQAGRKHGAIGYLITDWGDGGHPQPLAVSYLPCLAGASLSWCAKTFDRTKLVPVLNRDVFNDPTGNTAQAAFALGMAHRKLKFTAPNETPMGTVIAAPPAELRELFCRNGLKHYTRISGKNIRGALKEIEKQRAILNSGRARCPYRAENGGLGTARPTRFKDLAARTGFGGAHGRTVMPVHAMAAGAGGGKRFRGEMPGPDGNPRIAKTGEGFQRLLAFAQQGHAQHCSTFLKWRIRDYIQMTTSRLAGTLDPTSYLLFTSHASRRPSPRKFSASSVVTSTPPGKAISHQ